MYVGTCGSVFGSSLYIRQLDSAERMLVRTRRIILICLLAALHCPLDGVGRPRKGVRSYREVTKVWFIGAVCHRNSFCVIV